MTSGVRNLQIAVAGRRSRRSRSPVRHASSSPRRSGLRQQWEVLEHGGPRQGIPYRNSCSGKPALCPQVMASNSVATSSADRAVALVIDVTCRAWFAARRIHASRQAVYRRSQAAPKQWPPIGPTGEAFDRRAAYPVHLLARKTAEARMTAVDARRLPIAERLRRGQLVKGCSWTQGEPRMHGVIDVNRQGAPQFK
ncbi:hypothetical protein Rleg_5521 (plasmid) [Rhizobium leguminosarum bv. trifolii WSM1325]|uniref:Uncharacterized protein n=1 Tax=Rhizobium leguminosarum bv. trifolii (strain WSM1325) TaxID=395491 RepID=C6B8U9_RHILS|nr:hypothetical protein Rleg_5521 [Rhizobium leguminosarum bv. trifolii WSM1325]